MAYEDADHLLVPLLDGGALVAQIAKLDGASALLLLTQRRAAPGDNVVPIEDTEVMAILPVDLSTLPDGHWPVLGYDAIPHKLTLPRFPDPDGDAPHDPAIVEALANAIEGLYPWDGFPDRDFFAKLLRNPEVRPARARMAAQMPTPD